MTGRFPQTPGDVRATILAAAVDCELAIAAIGDGRPDSATRSMERCLDALRAVGHVGIGDLDGVLEARPLGPDDGILIRLPDQFTFDQVHQLLEQLRAGLPGRRVVVILGDRVEVEIGGDW